MTLEENIADYFELNGMQWKLKGGELIFPTPADVTKVLDKAASVLYDGKSGDQIEVAGLLILKTEEGFDVYIRAGDYK